MSLVGFGGGIPSIGCGCACLVNGALENDTDLPKTLLACATTRCDVVYLFSESIELSVVFLGYVLVSPTWEFFGGWILDGRWISFIVFTLCLMLICVEIGSEEQKVLIFVVGTARDDFGGVGLIKGRVSDEINIFFSCPCENTLCIEISILSSFV